LAGDWQFGGTYVAQAGIPLVLLGLNNGSLNRWRGLIRAKSNFICGCGFDRLLGKPRAQSRCCGNGAFASAVVARLSKIILDWQKKPAARPGGTARRAQ
jgi:hypothetical protein